MRSLNQMFREWNRKRKLNKLCGGDITKLPVSVVSTIGLGSYATGDYETAHILWEECIRRGHKKSIHNLAHMYLVERCGIQNKFKACVYLQLIAFEDSEASSKICEVMEEEGHYEVAYFYGLVSCGLNYESEAKAVMLRLKEMIDQKTRMGIAEEVENCIPGFIAGSTSL